jgi:simple sugar transport system permease protein
MLVMPAASAGFGFEWPAAAGLLAIVVVGAAVGFVNGFLVVRLRLNAFIVTLAMLIVLRGMLVGATKGGTLFDMPPSFFTLATTLVLGLPVSVWLAAVAFGIAAFMLRYHRLGRALYAIGGNPQAARAAGIRVERITWGVFVLGSVLASIGGLIVTGYVGAINANQGNGMIFTVFAAAVIGGISLDGGKGTMLGALSGVLLLGVVQNLLTLAQVPSFWIQAIYGAIILGSLMVARLAGGEGQD